MKTRTLLILLATLLVSVHAVADTTFRPFVLASVNDADLETQTAATVGALEAAGFTIAGQYRPLENAVVVVASSDGLKEIAAASDRGGYAAGQRVSIKRSCHSRWLARRV